MSPKRHPQGAAIEAASICCHALGSCPEVRLSVDPAGDGLVAAVPEYVHYVVLELLKNAMRATMQAHGGAEAAAAGGEGDGGAGEEAAPARGQAAEAGRQSGGGAPIVFADVPEVVISVRAHGDDDVMLVVADQGGGIPAEATDKVRAPLACCGGARGGRCSAGCGCGHVLKLFLGVALPFVTHDSLGSQRLLFCPYELCSVKYFAQ